MINKENVSKSMGQSQINNTMENLKTEYMPNQIDREFTYMMDFIKTKNVAQMKGIIKHNFEHMNKNDKVNYTRITDYYNKYKLWGTIDLKKEDYELIDNNAKALVEHSHDIEWIYNHLEDYRSKKILVTILYYWLLLDFKRIPQLQDKTYLQYFDFDLIKCDKNEVFVDIGAYIGDTLINYYKLFGSNCYKRIYCYEIVPANIEYIKKNVERFKMENVVIREKGASNKKGFLFLPKDEVSSTSKLLEDGDIKVETILVDEDIDEKVTFIKMDIEGGEEQALLGCRKKILENHPKLALSAYHNNEHLWKLARIIHEIDPTYRFCFRYYGGAMLPTEYLLYAI